jgi:hypothetical protein
VISILVMAISAREAADAHFVGSDDGYDAVQVDTYAARVAATLADQERALAAARAEIGRLEHALDLAHAVQSVMPARAVGPTGGVLGQALETAGADRANSGTPEPQTAPEPIGDPWSELHAWSEELHRTRAAGVGLLEANEEVRRLRGVADALATEAAIAKHGMQAGLSPAAQEEAEARARFTIDSAELEAAGLLQTSLAEAKRIVTIAEASAATATRAAELEARDLEQRTARLRTALRDAGTRFEELAGSTRTEIKMLEDFIDLETHAPEDLESLKPTDGDAIDLRDESPAAAVAPPGREAGSDTAEPRGFYERRLAGLRERLENS